MKEYKTVLGVDGKTYMVEGLKEMTELNEPDFETTFYGPTVIGYKWPGIVIGKLRVFTRFDHITGWVFNGYEDVSDIVVSSVIEITSPAGTDFRTKHVFWPSVDGLGPIESEYVLVCSPDQDPGELGGFEDWRPWVQATEGKP